LDESGEQFGIDYAQILPISHLHLDSIDAGGVESTFVPLGRSVNFGVVAIRQIYTAARRFNERCWRARQNVHPPLGGILPGAICLAAAIALAAEPPVSAAPFLHLRQITLQLLKTCRCAH
jgi:hypothetical protein